jgi:hypothetical protein
MLLSKLKNVQKLTSFISKNEFVKFSFVKVHLTSDRTLEQFLIIYFLPRTPLNPFAYHWWNAYHTLENTRRSRISSLNPPEYPRKNNKMTVSSHSVDLPFMFTVRSLSEIRRKSEKMRPIFK